MKTAHYCVDCGKLADGQGKRCAPCKNEREAILLKARRKRFEEAHYGERLAQARQYKQRMRQDKKEQALSTGDKFASGRMVALTLIADPRPVDEGGFQRGARFAIVDVREMLRAHAPEPLLLDGTRFERDGDVYVIERGRLKVA